MTAQEKIQSDQSSPRVMQLVIASLFLSGMTAISYEIIWQRLLVRTTGATLPAVSQIFCVFIGGLWAGSLLSIPLLRKNAASLRMYAYLELGIALFAIVIPLVFGEQLSTNFLYGLQVFVSRLAGPAQNIELLAAVIQNVLYFVVLVVPAALMGITFNCVTKYLDDERAAFRIPRFSLSSCYAANLYGGASGCLLTSFFLIPEVGLTIASMTLALFNLVVFFLLLLASLFSQKSEEPFAQLMSLFSPPKAKVEPQIEAPSSEQLPEQLSEQLKETDSVPEQVQTRASKKAAKLLAKRQAKQAASQNILHKDVSRTFDSASKDSAERNAASAQPSISAKPTKSSRSSDAAKVTQVSPSPADESPPGLVSALAIAFISSALIMVLEVSGTRLMLLLLGSSTYSLSSVLLAAFLAFALSAQLISWRARKQSRLHSLIPPLLLISSLAICGSMSLVQFIPLSLIESQRFLTQSSLCSSPFLCFILPRLFICLVMLIPPLAALGAIFPILLASSQSPSKAEGAAQLSSSTSDSVPTLSAPTAANLVSDPGGLKRTTAVGLLFAASSAGAIAGCLTAAFYLIPNSSFDLNGIGTRSGIETCLSTTTLFLLFMAVSVRVAFRNRDKPLKGFVARSQIFMFCCMAAGYAICLRSPWDLLLLSIGPGYFRIPERSHITQQKLVSTLRHANDGRGEPLFYKEGANTTVTVEQNAANNVRFLKTNGKVEAALPIDWEKPAPTSDAATQLILGGLPFYFLDKKSDVQSLIIGYGSGITTGAVDCRPETGSIKIAELEPAVYKASRFFIASNLDPFRSARKGLQKVSGLVADGRTFLRVHQAKYDLIISQPSEPWVAGSSDLFTREFWQLAASRLNGGGVMCQWLQLYSIDQKTLGSLLATFAQSFPDCYLAHPAGGGEIILIGVKERNQQATARALSVLDINKFLKDDGSVIAPRLSPEGKPIAPPTLMCDFVLDAKSVRRLAGNSQSNSDDRLLPEFRLPFLVTQKSDNVSENLDWIKSTTQTVP
jgi:predicted membrane-bound spermidine synthase